MKIPSCVRRKALVHFQFPIFKIGMWRLIPVMAMSFGFCGVKVRLLSGNILKICNFLTENCMRPRVNVIRACLKMVEIKK